MYHNDVPHIQWCTTRTMMFHTYNDVPYTDNDINDVPHTENDIIDVPHTDNDVPQRQWSTT